MRLSNFVAKSYNNNKFPHNVRNQDYPDKVLERDKSSVKLCKLLSLHTQMQAQLKLFPSHPFSQIQNKEFHESRVNMGMLSQIQSEGRNSGPDVAWVQVSLPFPPTSKSHCQNLPQKSARKEFWTSHYKFVFSYVGRIPKGLQ